MEGVTGSNPVSSTIALRTMVRQGRGGSRKVRTAIHLFIHGASPRLGLLALLSFSLLGSPAARASAVTEYDLTVLVMATAEGPDRVAISYAHVVNHSQLAAGVLRLARATRVATGGVGMREESVARGSTEKATSAEFTAPGLVRGRSAALPVEAIADSLPDWRRMQLVFVVGDKYTFTGPASGAANGYRIRLMSGPTAYQYDVERTGLGEQPGGQADSGQRGKPGGVSGQRAGSLWGGIRMALIGLSAAAACVAAWILVQSFRRGS